MRIFLTTIFFYILLINISFAEDSKKKDPLKLLNDKQEGLFFGSRNCEFGSDECVYFLSELLKEVKSDKDLMDSAMLGYSTYWYGDALFRKKRFVEAVQIWEEIVSNEIFDADHNLRYKNYALVGLGWAYFVEAEILNDTKSFNYMKMAADNGVAMALNNLGVFYEMGRNTKKNMRKAYENYKKAADLGNHWSHANIADFYVLGIGGVEKSFHRAIFQLKFSSIAYGTTNDNFKLKCILEKGKLPKDKIQYNEWMIDFFKKTKDPHGPQNIAWGVKNFKDKYKWHYLASIYSNEKDTKERSVQEMKVIEKINNLSLEETENIKKEADNWISINLQ
jgi:TPR repeat protein